MRSSALPSGFVPGQRYVSETQSELGLGLIVGVSGRRLEVDFPATGERRFYALPDPPLVRVEVAVEDHVRARDGTELLVREVRACGGLLTYVGEDDAGRRRELCETDLDDRLRFNRPAQRLLGARFDTDLWFGLRRQTWEQTMREAASPVRGLVGARIAPMAHQLDIAVEVARRDAPRVLLADEVGLGKTIEAGLILHRMLLTGRAQRVLVITPEPLLHQWLVELKRRFNLRFALFDAERFDAIDDPNPFLAEQQVLCALPWILAEPGAKQALLAAQWDLMVVDEAHHLTWSENEASPDYELVAALAAMTPGVLLLTATPEQLGRAGHFARLRLLDPQRFADLEGFLAEEAGYAPVASAAARLIDGHPLTGEEARRLGALLGDIEGVDTETLIERLLDRHGTGRVIFRNTRAAIEGFPQRVLHAHPLPEPEPYRSLGADPEARLAPERCDASGWQELDPRVDWLIHLLRAVGKEKVLLICAASRTVCDLRDLLFRRAGIQAAIFHEGMALRERDRAAAHFAAIEDGTRILLCSEIGSEGRNFQFAHHLVLFDLPRDPDLLEQRIGRLDRIGQMSLIRIHVPYLSGGPGEVLFRWYAEALASFKGPCPAGAALARQFGGALREALADPSGADALIERASQQRVRLNAELAAGRDRLLELHSHRPARAAPLVAGVEEEDAAAGVVAYLTGFWDGFGVEHEPAPGLSLVVRPGAHMLREAFPELPKEGLRVTFERPVALSHEHWEFMTWEHPLVRGAMGLIGASNLGTSTFAIVRAPGFKRASLLLEALYVAECQAPPALQAERFLPRTLLRFLLDETGLDRAHEVPAESLQGRCQGHNAKLAQLLLASRGTRVASMIAAGESRAQAALPGLREEALACMRALLDEEMARLVALARVNPNVRADEIAALAQRRECLERVLGVAQLRLDALRLILIG